MLLKHSHSESSNYSILPSQNLLYYLYHTILQHSQHPNFYFLILLIKIIFLHNKIIYPKITIIYNTIHYLLFLSHSFCTRTKTNLLKPPSPQAHHRCITHTWHCQHQPIIYHQHQKKKKKKNSNLRSPQPTVTNLDPDPRQTQTHTYDSKPIPIPVNPPLNPDP